jgi:hypothetical protein
MVVNLVSRNIFILSAFLFIFVKNQCMERNPILSAMESEDLIEIAFAINSDYPGRNEKAKKLCEQVYFDHKATLSRYINLGPLVAEELAFRLKAAIARREREVKYDQQLGHVCFKY